MNQFCKEDAVRAIGLLWRDRSSPIEVRILSPKGIYSGYFDSIEALATAVKCWNGRGQIYVTLNTVHPDCAARRLNRLEWSKSGELTKDAEITRRLNVYIDCDPKRLSGISSTNEEHADSLAVATAIRDFLGELGLPATALISSGNGHGLFLAIDLPADDDGLVKQFLEALATRFDTDRVTVDKSVSNASRIARLPGAMNCKGESTEKRPHRLACIIDAPDVLVPATAEQLQLVIDSICGAKPVSEANSPEESGDHFDVAAWLSQLGVAFNVVTKEAGTQYSLEHCPFKHDGHAAGGCAIFQCSDGKVVASCFHAKCKEAGWGWKELREKLDPGFDSRAEERALSGREGVRDPHRLARIVLEKFKHPDRPTIALFDGLYFTWRYGVWTEKRVGDIRSIITRCVKAEFDRYAAARARNGASCKTPEVTNTLVGNVLNALSSLIEVTSIEGPCWLDGNGWPMDEILVCKSAIVHLSGYLDGNEVYTMPHTPSLFVTSKLEFDFDPSASSPERWLQFLHEIWSDDPDSTKLLQEYFGYALTPDASLQKFLMLIGSSRGGKGVITRLLCALVGSPNYCAIRMTKLTARFALENAIGKSLIVVPDANMPRPDKAAEVVELVKAIVGRDPIDVDRKGRPVITALLPGKVVIASNKMIALPDESAALYNRMLVLRFVNSFLGKEDKQLDDKLRAELPGVLLWAIEGFRRLRDQGRFTEPETGLTLKYQLKVAGSPVASFVQERCVVGPKQRIEKNTLYVEFATYCTELGFTPCEASVFGRELLEAVPAVDETRPGGKKRPRYYKGIALRSDAIDDALSSINDDGGAVTGGDSWSVLREQPIGKRDFVEADSPTAAV
jgi:putative DNA primase/helicase